MTEKNLPREHIERAPLPWRGVTLTECGLTIADLQHVLTRAQFTAKIDEQGQQRAAFTTCMTCWNTAGRWENAWRRSGPVAAMEREVQRHSEHKRLERELYAIGVLIEAHREEFDAYVVGLEQTVDLAAKRAGRRHHAGLRGDAS